MATPFIEDRGIYPTMVELTACLCLELEASGLPPVCYCGLMPGNVSMDFCGGGCEPGGCGGQAWVRLVDAVPSSLFPTADLSLANCKAPMAYLLEVGVARCAPMGVTGGPNGYVPPTVAENVEAMRLQLADMAAMRRAIQCCFGSTDVDYILGSYSQIEVNGGGCLGGAFNVNVWEAF